MRSMAGFHADHLRGIRQVRRFEFGDRLVGEANLLNSPAVETSHDAFEQPLVGGKTVGNGCRYGADKLEARWIGIRETSTFMVRFGRTNMTQSSLRNDKERTGKSSIAETGFWATKNQAKTTHRPEKRADAWEVSLICLDAGLLNRRLAYRAGEKVSEPIQASGRSRTLEPWQVIVRVANSRSRCRRPVHGLSASDRARHDGGFPGHAW